MSSKRFKKLPTKTSELGPGTIEKLLPLVKKNCTTKFDESVDLSFQINNKQKKGEINIRTVINLPGGSGKKVKIAVVCEDAKSKEAKDAGADIVGGEDGLILSNVGRMNSAGYVPNQKGWNIDTVTNGFAEFQNIVVRGTLKTAVFQKDSVNVVLSASFSLLRSFSISALVAIKPTASLI